MITEARRVGRVLSVNHSAKADPIVLQGLTLVERARAGDVLAVDFYRSSDYPPYPGGPVPPHFSQGGYPFQDIGVHALYLLEAFLGRIHDVDIRYRSTGRDPGVFFDEWRGTVQCEKGVGQLFLSWTTRPIRNELFVHGTQGSLHIDCFRQTCTVSQGTAGSEGDISKSRRRWPKPLGTLYAVPRNLLRVLTGRLRPSPGIHAGVAAVPRRIGSATWSLRSRWTTGGG